MPHTDIIGAIPFLHGKTPTPQYRFLNFQYRFLNFKVASTLAWLLNDCRHSRDYEVLTVHSEAMIQISMIRTLLKRLRESFKTASTVK